MDPVQLVEDQFSKLHPRWPVSTRIGIVGAGPSGLSAAYALAKLGYNNVTVLEKHQTVGGMCESVDIEGMNMYLILTIPKECVQCLQKHRFRPSNTYQNII